MPAQLLTPEEEAHFQALEDLFSSKGWEIVTRDLTSERRDLPSRAFDHARSYEELLAARAKARSLDELLSLPAFYTNVRETLIQAREQEQSA